MTSTATKPAAKKAPAKPATRKPAIPAKAAPAKATPKAAPEPEATEHKTLLEALAAGKATLIKVRGNGTKRSLPYLPVGSEARKQAEAVAKMREDGQAVDAIAEALSVSSATARRFLTNLALSLAVESGAHDAKWEPGTKEVVVQTVVMK